jgi:peptide deformylase
MCVRAMTVRRVVTVDEPLLRKKAKKVHRFDAELKAVVDDMLETMHASNGLGLAAPQIGVSERVIVVELPEDYEEPEAGRVYALINPEVVSTSDETVAGQEGCLSVPGIVGEVERFQSITLKARTVKGRPVRISTQGFTARVFQHEIDHLDGVVFVDRVAGPDKLHRLTADGETEPIQVAAKA